MIKLQTYFIMKRLIPIISLIFYCFNLNAQTAREVGVEIRASLNADNYLRLTWLQQSGATRYQVYTKTSDNKGWDRIADLQGSDTSYIDSAYKLGTRKEYRVARTSSNYIGFDGNGYIVAGFNVPATTELGDVILLIENTYKTTAHNEITTYIEQLENEGYRVDAIYASPNDKVSDLKDTIKQHYQNLGKSKSTMIFLLGNIPVPYSGNYRPDGHTEHTGAWPADLYYGAFDITWTDQTVNNTQAQSPRNRNIPNDGKFDVSRYNSNSQSFTQYVNVPVGRVDLSEMPSFGADTMLIKRYLEKAMAFRTGLRKVKNQSLVDDNFGYFGSEAFASGGFRNASTFSAWNISTSDYRTEMSKESYLLSYGCGPGSYTSCSGVSSTSAFVSDSLLNPFTMTFGSYYGDWDNSDNFLRAPLASKGWGLSSVWSGRPYWMMHPCAHGAPLADAALSTFNTWNVYNAAGFMGGVHVALMGDPSLRMFVVDNVHELDIIQKCKDLYIHTGDVADLTDSILVEIWQNGTWKSLNTAAGSDTLIPINVSHGVHTLSVRYLKLLKSASGSWWQYGARRIVEFNMDTTAPNSPILGNVANFYCSDSAYIFINDGSFPANTKSVWTWNGTDIEASKGDTLKINNLSKLNWLYLSRTAENGCGFSDSIKIVVQELNVGLKNTLQSHYCIQSPYLLEEIGSVDTGIQTIWNWQGMSYNRGNSDTFTMTSQTTGRFWLGIEKQSNFGCLFFDSVQIEFSKPEKPMIDVLENAGRIGDTVRLSTQNVASQYQWNEQASKPSGQFSFVADSDSKIVSLRLIDSMGCVSDSTQKEFQFVVNAPSSISKASIKIYPNPLENRLWFSIPEGDLPWKLEILDAKGTIVISDTLNTGLSFRNIEGLSSGVYVVCLKQGPLVHRYKTVK